jgi:putative ABC transport system ATP-binding protein
MEQKDIIRLSSIYKSYFLSNGIEVPVLKGVDLSIQPGEFVSLMGHSGSGKSTLLNILGFLHTANTGTYLFDGEDISNYKDDVTTSYIRNRKIGFIFQLYYLIPRMNALQNVMLPAIYAWLSHHQAKEKALYYLDKVWLNDKIHNKPSELSWGQQQRVSIARSLINEPDLILADEPTGALDSVTGKEIMELIESFHKVGKTIIMVTHEKDIAAYAQRIIYLKDGVVDDHNYLIK